MVVQGLRGWISAPSMVTAWLMAHGNGFAEALDCAQMPAVALVFVAALAASGSCWRMLRSRSVNPHTAAITYGWSPQLWQALFGKHSAGSFTRARFSLRRLVGRGIHGRDAGQAYFHGGFDVEQRELLVGEVLKKPLCLLLGYGKADLHGQVAR